MTPLERRHAAIEATMAKYRDKPFAWGKVDCARVAAFHLKQLGYKIAISKAGSYSSMLGATRALQRLGYASLADMADGLGLAQIAPSRMLLGDIAEIEGEGPGAIGLYAGNGNLFCFHEDHPGLVTFMPTSIVRAWSVL
ncbi:hypothetical protein V474_07670 [Novosphingobium barchaimii LL02]|uniref:DUF6950 domain-containing protein n=1 Tax=Novosphingobium barchaimii LL02 TaxID=1114963 RepID=A0A0J7Y5G4_9SPHN|nr:hypothetical protein [Novosphingobium barchaimii]KMS59134.1 hypothetical protein V474_07670 [Novosphingobium barchaimii LL02]